MIESRRKGEFTISDDMINRHPDIVKGILGECIIINAKHDESSMAMQYTAINDAFQETALLVSPPKYKAKIMRRTSGRFNIKWKAI